MLQTPHYSRYRIYQLRFSNGKSYIGFTGQDLRKRYSQHIQKAKATRVSPHPLYDALRANGERPELIELFCAFSLEYAVEMERLFIQEKLTQVPTGYNISGGGEADFSAGVKRLKELRQDPEWARELNRKVSEGLKNSDTAKAWQLERIERSKAWANANPDEAKAISLANLEKANARIAELIASGEFNSHKFTEEDQKKAIEAAKLFWENASEEYRLAHGAKLRPLVKQCWADRTPEEIALVGAAISEGLSEYWTQFTPEEKEAKLAKTREGYAKQDHEKRKEKQREGIRKYWERKRKEKSENV